MGLELYAMSINRVRDMFSAAEPLSSELRTIAAEAFPAPPDPKAGLLGRLGPLFRHDPKLVIDPARPQRDDVDRLLTGQFTPPDRLGPTWLVVQAWLDALCRGHAKVDCTQAEFNDAEFALARAGLPSPVSIGTLLGNDAQLPLQPPPGTSIGYAKNSHVLSVHDGLRRTVNGMDDPPRAASIALAFLDQFASWGHEARAEGAPLPDLLVIWQR